MQNAPDGSGGRAFVDPNDSPTAVCAPDMNADPALNGGANLPWNLLGSFDFRLFDVNLDGYLDLFIIACGQSPEGIRVFIQTPPS